VRGRAAWAVVIFSILIGIIACKANVPISRRCHFGIEGIAKGTAVNAVGRFIDEAAINKNGFDAIDYILINKIDWRRRGHFVGTSSSTGWKNDAFLSRYPLYLTCTYEIIDSSSNSTRGILLASRREYLSVKNCFESGLSSSILIFNNNVKLFSQFWSRYRFCVSGADPSSLASDHIFLCGLGAINSGLGLLAGRFSETFVGLYESVCLRPSPLHFNQLIGHNFQLGLENQVLQAANKSDGQSEYGDKDGGIRGPSRSSVLGVLLLLCGAAVMKIAFDLLDAPHNPIRLRLSGWGIGGVAAILIGQGTILLLTGNWLP
jgi:hypothetical protein